MNATDEDLRKYVEVLHDTVKEVGAVVLEPNQSAQLLHNALLPATISIYFSTQFGVAFEYTDALETTIEVRRGSARVEDLIFSGPRALRSLWPMFSIEGPNITIQGGTTVGAFPLRLSKPTSNVTVIDAHFKVEALQWQRHVQFLQVFGDRSADRWSTEAASSRGKDEVLSAVYLAKQATKHSLSLEDYITKFRAKLVLLLGAYGQPGIAARKNVRRVAGSWV